MLAMGKIHSVEMKMRQEKNILERRLTKGERNSLTEKIHGWMFNWRFSFSRSWWGEAIPYQMCKYIVMWTANNFSIYARILRYF